MRRWLSGLLAIIMMFAFSGSLAEEPEGQTNADIQEAMVTLEGEDLGTTSENIGLILRLLQNEDVISLLQFQDVRDVVTEVATKAILWLQENPSVAGKIMTELGIPEEDQRAIQLLWESLKRIGTTLSSYFETEDGKTLTAEYETVRSDPDILESVENFKKMATSQDVNVLLDELLSLGKNVSEHVLQKEAPGILSHLLIEETMIQLLRTISESDWAKDSVPKLLNNQNFWTLFHHLADKTDAMTDMIGIIDQEITALLQDPEVEAFIRRALKTIPLLNRYLNKAPAENETAKEAGTP